MTPREDGHCSPEETPSALVQIHHMLGMEVPQILR